MPDQLPLQARAEASANGHSRLQIGRHKREVSWEKFEPLLDRLRTILQCSQAEALMRVGYSGQGNVATWRDAGMVPAVCYNAIQWVLHLLETPEPPATQPPPFSDPELIELLRLLRGRDMPDVRQRMMDKIIDQLGS